MAAVQICSLPFGLMATISQPLQLGMWNVALR